jgi:molybdate transport system substrate-binding protein
MSTSRTIALLLLLLLGGCTESAAEQRRTMVFASASLHAAFEQLAREFERRDPTASIALHFAGTPQLVVQVREGAPVDVFASADATNMQRVLDGVEHAGAPIPFATNRLTIVTAKGNAKGVRGLADLARDDLRVVLCGPEVPAGRYARQVLANAGVMVRSVSDEPSVKAVVSKIGLGEVDAGIVYATDAIAAEALVDAVALPAGHEVVCEYPIVALGSGAKRAAADAFVAFVLSADGRSILERFGFAAP